MERRTFIGCAATLPFAAAALAQDALQPTSPAKVTGCKITVLKKTYNREFDVLFRHGNGGPCPEFQEGQEFTLTEPWSAPPGFCQWAWADLRTYIMGVINGWDYTMVGCCTDGYRPVFFKIEAIRS